MSASEVSQLVEQITSSLSSEDNLFTLRIVDGVSDNLITERAVEIKDPFKFNLTDYVPNQKVMDLPRFLEVLGNLIEALQISEGIQESERVKLVSDFHPEAFHEFKGTVITYKILSRHPANMNTKATGRPQRRSTFSHDLRSANEPNKVIVVESRPIDHSIQLSCWSKNADQANRLALWLENSLIMHSWAFEVQGAERFYWEKRGADTYWTTGGQRLHQRPLNFFLRLREFRNKAFPVLKEFDLEVKTHY